ncbi:MAG: pyrroline-5-carboxylate reductase [Rhodospirillaceae bacterium]|nr:pyrroline-5-carboxylate reductase [Rhodospirillaceae bacterium]|tara:strand:+ start:262 stop:537 length:276 start_codon:yes stop_codon:yes gene_type:complete
MSREKHFIDDLTRVASGAIGAIGNVKGEVESKFKDIIQKFLDDMDYVSREEFEIVRELAQKSMEQNLVFEKKVKDLEEKIKNLSQGNSAKS